MTSEKGALVDGYQEQQHWRPPPMVGVEVAPPPPQGPAPNSSLLSPPPQHLYVSVNSAKKSVFEAYLLAVTLGLLGAHHFYLRRTWFGVAYFLTFGLFGVGYLVDLFRIPCLVRDANRALADPTLRDVKTKCDAYLLWFPCGLLGFHYFYLRKPAFGALYMCTLGLCGIGWLVDCCRMPWLVREANERILPYDRQEKSTCMAYILGLSPLGVLGLHHYYLDRPVWGVVYTCTLGLLGVGYVCDWFRIWNLVRRANSIATGSESADQKYADDAYILWLPFGLSGFHQFYLGRHGWGCLYLFTFGLLGLGWLFDSCRIWSLVKDYNATLEETRKLLRASQHTHTQGGATNQTVIHITNVSPGIYPGSGFQQCPPPAYTPTTQYPLPPHPPGFNQTLIYGSQQLPSNAPHAVMATGETRQPSPPPRYEASHPEKPSEKPQ